MPFEAASESQARSGQSHDDVEVQASKRPRLSGPLPGVPGLVPQNSDGSATLEEKEDDDGCATPPRELESRSASFVFTSGGAVNPSELPAAHSVPSPSLPPPTPHRRINPDSSTSSGGEAIHVDRMHDQQARSASTSELSSLSSYATSPALPSTSKLDAASTTRSNRGVSAKQKDSNDRLQGRSAEAEEALAHYVARNETLRTWAVGSEGRSDAVITSLQRFVGTNEGLQLEKVYRRLTNWRAGYQDFMRKLTSAGRSTRTAAWTNSRDLAHLAAFERHPQTISKWLRLWHDEVVVPQRTSTSQNRQTEAQIRRPRRVSSPTSTSASSSSEVAKERPSDPAAPLAQSYRSAMTETRAELVQIKGQLAQQAQEIGVLREQSQQQSQLLAQQAHQAQLQIEMLQRMDKRLGAQQAPTGEQ